MGPQANLFARLAPRPPVPTELVPGVHDITVREDDNGRRYRAYLVGDDVPTLFDAGLADRTDALFAGIEATGLEPERLVITHADPDHVGGFDAVVDRYDVETYVPEQTTLETAHGADIRYGDSDRIGGFEAIHVPGHSHDHHALINEEKGVLVAGDALSGADLRGFPEGYLLPHAAVYAEDLKQAELSLENLLDYTFDAALVYHGTAVTENADEVLERYVNFPGRPPEPVK
jgi:hydroxyacylglutathione hydrolase